MNEKMKVLKEIDDSIKYSLKDKVLIENTTDNLMVDAYNDGVRAMANQIRYYLNAMMDCESILEDSRKRGHKVTIERAVDD